MLKPVQEARRILRIAAGFTLLLIGIVLLVLPGPGWVTIFLGLALLAAEFVWARRLLDRLKNTANRVKRSAQSFAERRTD